MLINSAVRVNQTTAKIFNGIFSLPQFCTTRMGIDSFYWVLKQLIYFNIKTFAGNKKKTLFVLAYNGAVKSKIFYLIFFKSFYQHPCWDFLDLYDAIKGWNWFMKKHFEGCITRLKCIYGKTLIDSFTTDNLSLIRLYKNRNI